MKASGPGLVLGNIFFITDSISLLVINLFRYSVSFRLFLCLPILGDSVCFCVSDYAALTPFGAAFCGRIYGTQLVQSLLYPELDALRVPVFSLCGLSCCTSVLVIDGSFIGRFSPPAG